MVTERTRENPPSRIHSLCSSWSKVSLISCPNYNIGDSTTVLKRYHPEHNCMSVSLDLLIRAQILKAAPVKSINWPSPPASLPPSSSLSSHLRRVASFLATADLAKPDMGWNNGDAWGLSLGALLLGKASTLLSGLISCSEFCSSSRKSHSPQAQIPHCRP